MTCGPSCKGPILVGRYVPWWREARGREDVEWEHLSGVLSPRMGLLPLASPSTQKLTFAHPQGGSEQAGVVSRTEHTDCPEGTGSHPGPVRCQLSSVTDTNTVPSARALALFSGVSWRHLSPQVFRRPLLALWDVTWLPHMPAPLS